MAGQFLFFRIKGSGAYIEFGWRHVLSAARERADAGEELADGKRLCQIVISA